jgi:transcriptional regulator with XRE-family HTH domain
MIAQEIQQRLFDKIKSLLPAQLSLVAELAKVLNVSEDSVYRRLRGEKYLTIDELFILAARFSLSIDQLAAIDPNVISFNLRLVNEEKFTFDKYFMSIQRRFESLSDYNNREIIYAAKDIPLFVLLQFPILTQFKLFVWQKTILNFKSFANLKFDISQVTAYSKTLGAEIVKNYHYIPSIEIWNKETINSMLRQIKYYAETGQFKNIDDALAVCDELDALLNHMQKQAELGYKFLPGKAPLTSPNSNFKLYYNEIIVSDNTILIASEASKVTYLTYNEVKYLENTNQPFSEDCYNWLQNLIKKSVQISDQSEKERMRFFMHLHNHVNSLKETLL